MHITQKLPLSMAIVAILGISPPVGAVINASSTVLSATGGVVGLSPLLSVKEQVLTPESGIVNPGDVGNVAHTNFRIMIPAGGLNELNAKIESTAYTAIGLSPAPGYGYETPASLACVYHLVPVAANCNPNVVTANTTGGSKTIAIVDAYHYPNAQADLDVFSTQFGLPPTTITVANTGVVPPLDPSGPYNWELEAALDLQWAHAMAPNAKLILVEAKSSGNADLLAAVAKASDLVAAAGGGEVSMSWGEGEFLGEAANESYFKISKVVYFASSGDSAGTIWPCVSPNVVCVGGTTLRRDPVTKAILQEIAWIDGGGGISPYFPRPPYQNAIAGIVGAYRGVPDVSLDADPRTGAWVFYTPSSGPDLGPWMIVGGTSLSSPAFAGIVNSAGVFYLSSLGELYNIYGGMGTGNFRNISAGYCGPYVGWSATLTPQWDLCTGVGSDLGLLGK